MTSQIAKDSRRSDVTLSQELSDPTVRSTLYLGDRHRIEPKCLDFTGEKSLKFYSFSIGDIKVLVEAGRWAEFKEKVKAALDAPVRA